MIVEFTLDKAKYDALLADKIPQSMISKTPDGKLRIEYHFEGLPKDGPQINIGVPQNLLGAFNEAVVEVRIVIPKEVIIHDKK